MTEGERTRQIVEVLGKTCDVLSATIDNLRNCYNNLPELTEYTAKRSIDLTIDHLALCHRTVKKRIYRHRDRLADKPFSPSFSKDETNGC